VLKNWPPNAKHTLSSQQAQSRRVNAAGQRTALSTVAWSAFRKTSSRAENFTGARSEVKRYVSATPGTFVLRGWLLKKAEERTSGPSGSTESWKCRCGDSVGTEIVAYALQGSKRAVQKCRAICLCINPQCPLRRGRLTMMLATMMLTKSKHTQ
jgi:hypothetical protein